MIRKEKEKAKAKEKEQEKGKRKSKNTLEGDNCFNLSLLADLRYVMHNIIEIICNELQ